MSGGTIRGNSAANDGGGVYIATGGGFTMSGGTIEGNSAANNGRGVYVSSTAAGFSMAGNAFIALDNDVYLQSGARITITQALTGGAPSASLTPANYIVPPPATRLLDSASAPMLASEALKFAVTPSGGNNYKIDSNGYLAALNGLVRLASTNNEYNALQPAFDAAAPSDTVYLLGDIAVSATTVIPSGKTITISPFGTEKRIVRGINGFDSLIRVESGSVLSLTGGSGNLILDGGSGAGRTGTDALIFVLNGLLEIHSGVILQNNHNSLAGGSGGGIHIYSTSNATAMRISGGIIRGNRAARGGGIYQVNGTTEISGGIIEGNTSTGDGSIRIDNNGELILSGSAEIRGNHAKGVYANSGTFIMNGASIRSNDEGGVYVESASFTMTDGVISENNGDGIFINSGTCSLAENAYIGVQNGGAGVNFSGGPSFSMKGDALVDSTVQLGWGKFITVAGILTRPYPVATITPPSYFGDPQLVTLDSGVSDISLFAKFAVTPSGGSYHVGGDGKLASGPP
jgi:hypothetical protein